MNNVNVLDQANEISTLITDARKRISDDEAIDLTYIQGKVLRLYENVAREMSPDEISSPDDLSKTLSTIMAGLKILESDMSSQFENATLT
jgi:hypothetical protein